MKIILAGSSGFIGTALLEFLQAKGHEVIRLVRSPSHFPSIFWDPHAGKLAASELEGSDALINLSGENIATGRWTAAKKRKIYESRILSTQLLSNTLTTLQNPPKVWINASAIGYYGTGFLAEVCREWEAATIPASKKGIRVVTPRIGMVLDAKGGALASMLLPFKLGLGGVIGTGEQYISWISLEDLVRLFEFCQRVENVEGPVNAVSPHPVTNREFTKALGAVLHRPTFMAMPAFLARLIFGEMADELLLSSLAVQPQELQQRGFHFHDCELKATLQKILK